MALVRYQVSRTHGGPSYHEWPAVEFVGRMAALVPPPRKLTREARRAASAAGKAWAACVKKIFEVDPVRCGKCGGEMKLAAVMLDDVELDRILAHQGWPVAFPKTRPPWAPPRREDGECSQADPRAERWDGVDGPSEDWPA